MSSNLPKRRRPQHAPFRAARAFYLTVFIGVFFATYAILTTHSSIRTPNLEPQHVLYKRSSNEIRPTLNEDEQCRLVHHAKDQCKFIQNNCPAEEPGFTAYLSLYYCRLGHAKAAAFIILISWLGLLFSTIGIAASDFFCINLSTISTILGMSESMAGVTFLAFGNGSPDVFSTFAAMSTNSGSLAVGELFGAAGFITAVVSGSMALIRPFQVSRRSFVRDVGFFTVAAAFSIVFLWDGKLHLWECVTMVLFYVFYVAFVVVWHWWLGRRRRRREKEAAARGHFIPPGDEYEIEGEEEEAYRDDPDEAPPTRPNNLSRGVSREDWSALERGGEPIYQDQPDEDEEEEARDRWMSELNSNMRLTRPRARSRANTLTPVRPSLVGALEFQAVLKSLQKSRNIQTYPMDSRRYSDDPTYTSAQQQDNMSSVSDPAARPPYQVAVHEDQSPTMERPAGLNAPSSGRARAVSANDAQGLRIDPDLQLRRISEQDESLIDLSESDQQTEGQKKHKHSVSLEVPRSAHSASAQPPPSPTFQISPAEPQEGGSFFDSRNHTGSFTRSPNRLSIPGSSPMPRLSTDNLGQDDLRVSDSPSDSPRPLPNSKHLPRIVIPGREPSRSYSSRGSTPTGSPFPRYRDDPSPPGSRPPSIYLPPASIASPESLPPDQSAEQESPKRPTFLSKWWPYHILPPPGLLISTLFPTIYHWHEKNYWEKALGVVAAPSVFLLTITLPVVESGKDDDESEQEVKKDLSLDSARSKSIPGAAAAVTRVENGGMGSPDGSRPPGLHRHASVNMSPHGLTGKDNAADLAMSAEQHQRHNYGEGAMNGSNGSSHAINAQGPGGVPIITDSSITAEPEPQSLPPHHHQHPPELWNRWLLIAQLFLAPLFIVLAIYSQSPTDITPSWLIRPVLICLLVSLILLIPLLLTTTPTHKPAYYRYILSLAGFVVSISWISTIASQVVGALKALAVILNMSHAIMGLTIFAVGNSLGDLVADVTVARLGYPVMALSACFGGPMLNILLGIGLSGSYILIRGAEHRQHRHPGDDLKFKSYHIEVSNTLIVSGATLLVTLVGLLVFVPMNKWVLSKRIGWALIAVWTLSTIGNVVLEVTGFDKGRSEDLMGSIYS